MHRMKLHAHGLVGCWSLVAVLGCGSPEPAPEPAQVPAQAPPTPRATTPLPLASQLALAPPDTEFLAIRDLQALADQGVPWTALAVDQAVGEAGEADVSSPRARVVAFSAALRKLVEGPDPPLGRSSAAGWRPQPG
jgi:hypothetical protein